MNAIINNTVDTTVWTFHGRSFKLDFEDYELAVKFNKSAEMLDALNTNEMEGTPEAIKHDCTIIKEFFESFIGVDIFSELPLNRRIYMEAVTSIFAFIKRQRIADATALMQMFRQFAPPAEDGAGAE